jgi:transcriptional regulator with XRE-family HTH domain
MAKASRSTPAASTLKRGVGERLALAREALGWTGAEMAREYAEAGITGPKLSEWESGKYYPDPYFLLLLCDDHGFTMDWFYRGVRAGVSVERAADLRRAAKEKKEASAEPERQAPEIVE